MSNPDKSRAHLWKPGDPSPNPGGRPKAIREALREFRDTDDLRALRERLRALALDESNPKVAIAAIKEYHDRAYGRAAQSITVEDVTDRLTAVVNLDQLTETELAALQTLKNAKLRLEAAKKETEDK